MLQLELDTQFQRSYKAVISEDVLRHAVEQALETAGADSAVQVGLVIAGDRKVRSLNRQYRGIDATTDVLSFALEEQSGGEDFVLPPDGLKRLGEIIISYPQAARQAEEQRHSVEREITLLVVHGVLHLLGYDHERLADRRKMRALEQKSLDFLE